jgi:tetrapyrrole methylase family protein/MazG family protein
MPEEKEQSFAKLVDIMRTLRGEQGCLWDRKQTHESLKPYLIEEAYEVLAAIDQGASGALREELGDLLFQIIFHAQIAAEQGRFDIYDILRHTAEKMTRRHPHVFGDTKVGDTREILANWERIKQAEKRQSGKSVLDGVPQELPALLRAHRVQEKAARVGFDHTSLKQVFAKLEEELAEFEATLEGKDPARMEEELGDLLFCLVNVARFVEVNPEEALRRTIMKFISRFRYLEERVVNSGHQLNELKLEELDRLWEEAKDVSGIP